ncbi:DUF2502 domain-containing protein [Cedecea neteri]|uniref:DUF2502 domain-containing protein n=1 Tax=Cedecea neteri TaxID=158822 RepID=A0AAN0S3I7_9ENTR|nr:DUF2502 domain-containing protein [Cedecea neteri]AIR60721.1 hypothetical protein LH23_08645 [Cedecea neteri]WPU22401.1 DUF2502 domain-containing protein [Cedecea neteri]
MLKSIFLALSLLVVTPLAVQAGEITLVPAVTLHFGDQDNHGRYWDGHYWRDHDWWARHYEWREHRWQRHARFDGPPRDHHDNRWDR